MTKPKPEHLKLRAGRPRLPDEERRTEYVPLRLTAGEAADLDSVTGNRSAFALAAVKRAVAAARKKQARP